METKQKKEKLNYGYLALMIGGAIFGVWLLGFCIQKHYIKTPEGIFTSFSALFSALAFGGLIITAMMQKDELEMQRQELTDTREEFKQQNSTLSQQRFENTFFQLLQKQSDIIMSLSIEELTNVHNGLGVFDFINKKLWDDKRKHLIAQRDASYAPDSEQLKITPIISMQTISTFEILYNAHENKIGHYYRHLVVILQFIDGTDSGANKQQYFNIFSAQLSLYEMFCLFYFGLSKYGRKDTKDIIEEYNLFKHLRSDVLISSEHYIEYDFSKFNPIIRNP